MLKMERGFIQIYTGEGKGKTTAAVGLAVRAIGRDLKVGFIYFHKAPEKWGYGELKILEEIGVKVHGFAEKHPHFFEDAEEEEIREETLRGVEFVEGIFKEKSVDLLILDEIIISVRDDFLKEEELLELLDKKPEEMELVLTGRGASDALIERADLVSRIENVKHYFDEGMEGRPGIEF